MWAVTAVSNGSVTGASVNEQGIRINTADIGSADVKRGDKVLLSGVVYTARDAAHKLMADIIGNGKKPPFPIAGSVIYYAGPTETPPGLPIGSCGPTTSSRMDKYTPRLLDLGLAAVIGKGGRDDSVVAALRRNKALYLCAIGGCGALAAEHIVSCDVVAFPQLGCESVKRLTFADFPLIVGIDQNGDTLF